MDRYFKMFSQLNLKAPMPNCLPTHSRTLIHEGDLRFKDNVKEARPITYLLILIYSSLRLFGCIRVALKWRSNVYDNVITIIVYLFFVHIFKTQNDI